MTFTPKQIIPAFNWYASCHDEDDEDHVHIPIICWALGEDNQIHGMIPDDDGNIHSARERSGFVCYEMLVSEPDFEIEADMLN